MEKSICAVLDQMNIGRELNFDVCYRQGAYNKNRTHPILISFAKQSDRDLVYAKRMDLRHSSSYQKVWVNEDLGPTSRRARNMIRHIARQAQNQGIDHRTGKYTIYIGNTKYDESTLDDLPPPLHPSNVKQVQIDPNTIAYQSEHAPFSNFYPSPIVMGKYKFVCLEQAYQFLRAKTLNKLLAASKIYLSRDPVDIKRMGDELGTSDIWEAKQFDVMYVCLIKKFEQNADLRKLLLSTGNCLLVEATPGRLWGYGATLSSTLLRKHQWPGENKHGKILMTVRDELRSTTSTAQSQATNTTTSMQPQT